MKWKYFAIFIFYWAPAQAQVHGKVLDSKSRQPLEGASIEANNPSHTRTQTDPLGNFTLFLPKSDSLQLHISYIGFRPVTLSLSNQESLRIELEPDLVNLKDVVVLQSNSLAKFSTLGKIDLDLKPVRNTQELLRLVPGLFIAQHAGGGKAEQIFLRGFDCDHGTDVQVSVDGMPINMVSHAHGQGYADTHFIIPETINNIDFGAGPYYTDHGNLNTAGYVSFSTFQSISQSRIQLEGGRFNTYRALAMIDLLPKRKDRQNAYLASDFYYTNGPTDNKQHFKRFNLFGKYNLAINEKNHLSASFSAFSSDWDASGQVPERAVKSGLIGRFGSIDPTEGGHTERYNANMQLTTNYLNGTVWENQAYYNRYDFKLFSDFTFFMLDTLHGDEIKQAEDRNVWGYLSRVKKKYDFGSFSLQSIYGMGFRYDQTNNSQLSHVEKRHFLSNIKLGDIRESNSYAYTDQQINLGRFIFNGGIRLDYLNFNYFDKLGTQQQPSQGKTILSPKVNIQYTLNSKVQVYLKSGKGFHSNDTRVVVANQGYDILPAAYGADLGLILKPTNELFLNIALWYLFLDQEFIYAGDDGNIIPSGKTRREGVDIIGRYQFNKNLFANVNLNLTRPRALGQPKGADYIPLAPTFTSTGGLYYKAKQGFNGSITYRYIKSRPANEDNSITAKGYFLTDASINYSQSRYEIGLAIENIFNVKWNEAQFATQSQLKDESAPVTELNFTPGTPLFARVKFAIFF